MNVLRQCWRYKPPVHCKAFTINRK